MFEEAILNQSLDTMNEMVYMRRGRIFIKITSVLQQAKTEIQEDIRWCRVPWNQVVPGIYLTKVRRSAVRCPRYPQTRTMNASSLS